MADKDNTPVEDILDDIVLEEEETPVDPKTPKEIGDALKKKEEIEDLDVKKKALEKYTFDELIGGVNTDVVVESEADVKLGNVFKDSLYILRSRGKKLTEYTNNLLRPELYSWEFFALNQEADTEEMKANIVLAKRALEDAVMRLGKVIQAMDNGIYKRR